MSTKLVLALIAAAVLQGCAVYVPPVEVGGLVLVPVDEQHEHRDRHREHHGHHGHHDHDED